MPKPAQHFKPEGYHTITPYITVDNANKAIEFYKQAFQAEELYRIPSDDGKVMHAEIKIGDSVIMLADEFLEWGNKSPKTLTGSTASLCFYVKDCDAALAKAESAGAKVVMGARDEFWGDRCANIEDPFGHKWSIMTHKLDLTPEEISERQKEWLLEMQKSSS